MNALQTTFRPELDPLWPRLTNDERALCSAWKEIFRRMDAASDKSAALVIIQREFGATVGSVSRSTVYRKQAAGAACGVEAIVGRAAVRRARGMRGGSKLPPAFISFWRQLCGEHQRRKVLSAWRHLMRDFLIAGETIPGYGTDWRGIWLMDHPERLLPSACPYTASHEGAAACAPAGWSYSSLSMLAPEPDVWAGAAVGVHAMRSSNPVIPHTRVGLRAMSVVTMDDVKLDAFCWYPGEREPRRPVGLGVLDVTTGCMVDFTLVPAQERSDGTVSSLQAFWARYAWANILCNVGIDRDGVTALLEHGSAGLSEEDERRINEILGPRPDGGAWLTVVRSSTSGAPLLKGLFSERGRGRPTHKAMLESAWNLLHNELQHLPAPSGRNWDAAPQDTVGWTREDKALIRAAADVLAKECPAAVEAIANARTHALPYNQLAEAVQAAIRAMNMRRNHHLQDWLECGFVRQVVEMGGALLPLDRAAEDFAGGDAALREQFMVRMQARSRRIDMSPAEAFASFDPKRTLKRFDAFTATRILGEELSQKATVVRRQFTAEDHFTGKGLVYDGLVTRPDGTTQILEDGDRLHVWVNPIRPDYALVSRPDGVFMGVAKLTVVTAFGQREDGANLGFLSLVRGEQRRRAAVAAGGRLAREVERRRGNARAFAEAFAADGAPVFGDVDAASLEDLSGARDEADVDGGEFGQEPDPTAFLKRMRRP